MVRVAAVERGCLEPVFDLTVPGTHNFLAEGVVVHNCVFEIIENCPPERHREGEGCKVCPLMEICKEKVWDERTMMSEWVPGPGRAARAHGWMRIDDVIAKYRSIPWDVFRAQWLSQRPETSGLVYPMFEEDIHVIDYTYTPNYEVLVGIDFGFTNPSVAVYIQPQPNGDMIIFHEDYEAGRTADEFAESIKREPFFKPDQMRIADPANAGDRATLIKHGVPNEPADKSQTKGESSIVNGINLVRWVLAPKGRPTPILYVDRRCRNTIREFKRYHHPDEREGRNLDETPMKQDDHSMDSIRYLLAKIYQGKIIT